MTRESLCRHGAAMKNALRAAVVCVIVLLFAAAIAGADPSPPDVFTEADMLRVQLVEEREARAKETADAVRAAVRAKYGIKDGDRIDNTGPAWRVVRAPKPEPKKPEAKSK